MNQVDTEYNKMVKHVLREGSPREDRTGVGTLSTFGYQYRINLQAGFPLISTKKVLYRKVIAELLWFLRGETNIKTLGEAKPFWKPWADKNGECDSIYSKQWRRWEHYFEVEERIKPDGTRDTNLNDGKVPPGFEQEYPTTGAWCDAGSVCACYREIDQIKDLIQGLKDNPISRRHIVSAWNPADLYRCALPSCHVFFQCYIDDNYLDLQMYQRSADLALGVPVNIASYATLMHLLSREVGLIPRYFIHSIGDLHIYSNHLEKIKEQVNRNLPRESRPTLKIDTDKDFWEIVNSNDIDCFVIEDYSPLPFIRYEVAV